jgi:hypothetical protein
VSEPNEIDYYAWKAREYKAQEVAMAMARMDALSDEITRMYNSMKPTKWRRYSMSHLCWHRKRRIRDKWRKKLGSGPWIKLAPGAMIIRYEGEVP